MISLRRSYGSAGGEGGVAIVMANLHLLHVATTPLPNHYLTELHSLSRCFTPLHSPAHSPCARLRSPVLQTPKTVSLARKPVNKKQ
ncbi:hypothetical protein E2C01_095896 [Portunus trituberculatus]|uniref:Uncharacterized protein n=1 Tax=Portunus trituberculatus TaxID=210409 RepID=A0A5B7K6U8_PORTR|nr:hypothetical protein [Portunus trituberculatus]